MLWMSTLFSLKMSMQYMNTSGPAKGHLRAIRRACYKVDLIVFLFFYRQIQHFPASCQVWQLMVLTLSLTPSCILKELWLWVISVLWLKSVFCECIGFSISLWWWRKFGPFVSSHKAKPGKWLKTTMLWDWTHILFFFFLKKTTTRTFNVHLLIENDKKKNPGVSFHFSFSVFSFRNCKIVLLKWIVLDTDYIFCLPLWETPWCWWLLEPWDFNLPLLATQILTLPWWGIKWIKDVT